MAKSYIFKNISALLTKGFSDEDLRRLCYDLEGFRPVIDRQLSGRSSKGEIVDALLDHADRTLQFDVLLALAKEQNPARYEAHQPYYKEISTEEAESDEPLKPEEGSVLKSETRQKPTLLLPPKGLVILAIFSFFVICVVGILCANTFFSSLWSPRQATSVANNESTPIQRELTSNQLADVESPTSEPTVNCGFGSNDEVLPVQPNQSYEFSLGKGEVHTYSFSLPDQGRAILTLSIFTNAKFMKIYDAATCELITDPSRFHNTPLVVDFKPKKGGVFLLRIFAREEFSGPYSLEYRNTD